jgi:hypothetical protein
MRTVSGKTEVYVEAPAIMPFCLPLNTDRAVERPANKSPSYCKVPILLTNSLLLRGL